MSLVTKQLLLSDPPPPAPEVMPPQQMVGSKQAWAKEMWLIWS